MTIEVTVKDSPDEKPEDMAIEVTANDTKSEAEKNKEKEASPSLTRTPVANKPAKRRITPMAIDP